MFPVQNDEFGSLPALPVNSSDQNIPSNEIRLSRGIGIGPTQRGGEDHAHAKEKANDAHGRYLFTFDTLSVIDFLLIVD